MTHFLLTYDRHADAASIERFEDVRTAQGRYATLEREHIGSGRFEIVLLSAESEADLHETHGRFFSRGSAPVV